MGACRDLTSGSPDGPVAPDGAAKLDPAVAAAIAAGRSAQVILLGTLQLFAPVGGLDAFQREHAAADRLTLRSTVITTLKQNAQREQAAILSALGRSDADRRLWIVNALVLTLAPADIERAAALPEVRFIYPANEPLPAAQSPGITSLVLPPPTRAPFDANGKLVAWNVDRLGAPRVWGELGVKGEGAVVAVLDAGTNYAHHDLRSHIWRNTREVPVNGVDDDINGYIDDVHGYDFAAMRPEVRAATGPLTHGTMTAGIIAGDGSRGIVTGVAPRAQLMILRGNSPTALGLAYEYALENGADVLSMSFSIPNLGNIRGLWRLMSDQAVAAGLVLIGGAGNSGSGAPSATQIVSPKDIPSVIAVGGVDSMLRLAPFSSRGPVEWESVALYGDFALPGGLVKPDLAAFPGPGYPVLGATDTEYTDPAVTSVAGNSFSGPQGAGVAALVLSAAPSLPAWRVKEIMEETARDLGTPGRDNEFGAGLLDAYAAVTRALLR
jgi:subtilisin family serine protease